MLFIRDDQLYEWVDFTAGEAVPENSPQIGVFTGGEPIYLVRKPYSAFMSYTYYVPGETEVTLRDPNGWRATTTTMQILMFV